MTTTVEQICTDLGIEIVPCNVTITAKRTKAIQTMRRLLAQHGEGHIVIVLRTIVGWQRMRAHGSGDMGCQRSCVGSSEVAGARAGMDRSVR